MCFEKTLSYRNSLKQVNKNIFTFVFLISCQIDDIFHMQNCPNDPHNELIIVGFSEQANRAVERVVEFK